MSDTVECPFCKEDNFDLIGLKKHISYGECQVFNDTETLEEERQRLADSKGESE